MKVLVACEFSGVVREAFAKRGHDAWSCDLLPTEIPGQHIQGDVLDVLGGGWDLMIAHPPCTHLAVSGAAHFAKKIADGRQQQGIDLFMKFVTTNIPKWCVENPVGIMSTKYRKPNQIIQPYYFGDAVKKTTCLWTNGLPLLKPTNMVEPELIKLVSKTGRVSTHSKWDYNIFRNHFNQRGHLRSKTFQGIADAMAEQWGCL